MAKLKDNVDKSKTSGGADKKTAGKGKKTSPEKTPAEKTEISSIKKLNPVALILAGYDKPDAKTRRQKQKELEEAYDGDVIYMGKNKFLYDLGGQPVIKYVLDAVFNARKGGRRIYETIYLYNNIKDMQAAIDLKAYPNLVLKQMTKSVGGHWRDFYFNHLEYGQRVDVFFGDTPRITSGDVEWIHGEYNKILNTKRDHRGVLINKIFSVVDYADMEDNWLPHRIKFIKVGKNRGKLRSFVGFEDCESRVGNSCGIYKHPGIDKIAEYEVLSLMYNMRKALTPNIFSRILFYLWKTKNFSVVRQIKNHCLREEDMLSALIDVVSNVFKISMDEYAGAVFHIRKNASRWENDIDGPKDLEAFRKKYEEMGFPSRKN